jgi:purine-nucleoside phosphorylase
VSNVQDATSELKRQIDEAVASLRGRTTLAPEVAVILGTGLGTLAEGLTVEARVPYRDIPHFAASTVESHKGGWCSASLAGRPAVVMSGRVHFYEGYTMRQVSFPVRVMQALGARPVCRTRSAA